MQFHIHQNVRLYTKYIQSMHKDKQNSKGCMKQYWLTNDYSDLWLPIVGNPS